MIKITLQQNTTKTDTIYHDDNTIAINDEVFEFPTDRGVTFESVHSQIIGAYRDESGTLHATVIKQYTKDNNVDSLPTSTRPQNIGVTVPVGQKIQDTINEKTVSELLSEKQAELEIVRKQILDAQADEEDELLPDLRVRRNALKSEIASLEIG